MVQALERKFEVAFVNEDAIALAAFFARDAIIVPSRGPMATGGDILRFFQNLFAENAKGGRKPSAFTKLP
jgi:ketosteroid isomerase-like protein